jgi:hypothetical protein
MVNACVQITSLCSELEAQYGRVREAAAARGVRLEGAAHAQHFEHDAAELDAWLQDKAVALARPDDAADRHQATRLLTRHKVL